MFGRFGWSDGNVNPFQGVYSFGSSGKGSIPERDNDTWGIGYTYIDFSDDMPRPMHKSYSQTVELYYNIEVTPWLHVTPDLQIIGNPSGDSDNETAIVAGLRMHMTF